MQAMALIPCDHIELAAAHRVNEELEAELTERLSSERAANIALGDELAAVQYTLSQMRHEQAVLLQRVKVKEQEAEVATQTAANAEAKARTTEETVASLEATIRELGEEKRRSAKAYSLLNARYLLLCLCPACSVLR